VEIYVLIVVVVLTLGIVLLGALGILKPDEPDE
jgi:hypothetical protein